MRWHQSPRHWLVGGRQSLLDQSYCCREHRAENPMILSNLELKGPRLLPDFFIKYTPVSCPFWWGLSPLMFPRHTHDLRSLQDNMGMDDESFEERRHGLFEFNSLPLFHIVPVISPPSVHFSNGDMVMAPGVTTRHDLPGRSSHYMVWTLVLKVKPPIPTMRPHDTRLLNGRASATNPVRPSRISAAW